MKFTTVNVFSKGTMGNPVACFLQPQMTTEEMQQLTQWMNLSESIFIFPSKIADYRIRIFAPTVELTFGGHPTVGSAKAAIEFGLLYDTTDEFTVEAGGINGGLVLNMKMVNGKPFVETPLAIELPLKTPTNEWVQVFQQPIVLYDPLIVHSGPKWLIFRTDHNDIHKLTLDKAILKQLILQEGVMGITLYSIHPGGSLVYENANVLVRTFFLDGDVIEDPVCGSANAGVAYHLKKFGHLEKVGSEYRAFQGHCCGRRGIVEVIVKDRIWIGGDAQVILKGTYAT